MDLSDTTLRSLAAKLTNQSLDLPGYGIENLIAGLGAERLRLAQRPFVVVLDQMEYDYDGRTDFVFILESFESQAEAIAFTESSASKLLKAQTSGPDSMGKKWSLESQQGVINDLPNSQETGLLREIFNVTYKLRASDFDTIYNSFRVIGRFTDFVVCDGLFDFCKSKFDFWYYFVGVGESLRSGKQRPTPFSSFKESLAIEAHQDTLSEAENEDLAQGKQFPDDFERTKLKSPVELPDLSTSPIVLKWGFEEDQVGDHWTVISHEGHMIWSEPTVWEGYKRFVEIVAILKQKYEKRLVDVVPTAVSERYLYGDDLNASGIVERTRAGLR